MDADSRWPKVSVIVPVYQTEKYLADCVRSLQAQTYRQLEILLVDDGSQDASAAICAEFCRTDARVRFFTQRHRGVSAARNRALDACTGDYILFLDSDDLLHPALIEQYVRCMQESTAAYIHCAYMRFTTPSIQIRPACAFPRPIPLSLERTLALFRRGKLRGIGGKCFRAQCLAGLRFDEGLHFNEDTAFLWQVHARGAQALFYNAPWYYYRQHPDSACASFDGDSRANLTYLKAMRAREYAGAGASAGAAYYARQWEGLLIKGLQKSRCQASGPANRAQRRELRADILAEMRHPLFAQLPYRLRATTYLCLVSRPACKAAWGAAALCRRMRGLLAAHSGPAPVCRGRENGAKKRIALTFDADYGADDLCAILAALGRHGAAATFFACGIWVEAFPEKAALLAKSGCEVMNFSDTGTSLTRCSAEDIRDELETANCKIAAVTGVTPTFMCCPNEACDARVLRCIRERGMQAVHCSADGEELPAAGAKEISAHILRQAAPGGIIRLQSEGRHTPEVLERILPDLAAQGYRFVKVSELLAPGAP